MNEKKEKENKTKKPPMSGEKKFYLYTAIACAAVLVAIVTVALLVTNLGKVDAPSANLNSSTVDLPADGPQEEPEENEPVVTLPEGMVLPVEAAVSVDYGFYHNQTLNSYYEHAGVDFMAAAGTEVFAAEDGTIESVYKDDLLSGTEIVVNHGNGLKTLYRFVTETAGVKVGDKVKKGDLIATVAEANGDEYKDGAHLHFEVIKNNQSVDPATYLTLEEK
jgi:murein DD-endopeptidase MepM/ murein hydrolase activator NlpD